MAEDPIVKLRPICLALPETSERQSHGSPSFYIREKRQFLSYVGLHHEDKRLSFWCAAPDGVQAELIDAEPDRFFRPPYVGAGGWLGVRLDVDLDWTEIEQIVTDAYRVRAPKALVARLDVQNS
jgi:hypothetical protein